MKVLVKDKNSFSKVISLLVINKKFKKIFLQTYIIKVIFSKMMVKIKMKINNKIFKIIISMNDFFVKNKLILFK